MLPIDSAGGPGGRVVPARPRRGAPAPEQPALPIDATFPGETAPDFIDDWVPRNTRPFCTRD